MKIGKLTKTAMVVALMMGQVTPPSNTTGYYEDDGDFESITTALTSGWGWGLNKAYAACDDISDHSEARLCQQREEFDPDYTGGVNVPPLEDTWDFPDDPFEDSDYGDQDSGVQTGGGGVGTTEPSTSEPTPLSPTDKARIKACKTSVAAEVTNCKDTYFYYVSGAGGLCARVTWGIATTYCGAGVASLIYEAHKWCDTQGEAKIIRECK